jgi:hypothetical protein
MLGLEHWGLTLGMDCGRLESRPYPYEATKEDHLLAFHEAL